MAIAPANGTIASVCARREPGRDGAEQRGRQTDHERGLPVLAVELQRLGDELADGARRRAAAGGGSGPLDFGYRGRAIERDGTAECG